MTLVCKADCEHDHDRLSFLLAWAGLTRRYRRELSVAASHAGGERP